MKVLAIIQARMGSRRLPGKMLIPIIEGKGALELMIERVSSAKNIDKLIVATTTDPSDDALVGLCEKIGIECHRGSVEDVLDRFYTAVKSQNEKYNAIVRLTGDCPLHDSKIIDRVISEFKNADADYVSNIEPPTYPDGLDTEVMTFETLEKIWKEAALQSEREHVTWRIRSNPSLFNLKNVENEKDLSCHRWTLDEEVDFKFVSAIFANFYKHNPNFGMKNILEYIKNNPGIADLNKGINRNEGLDKSLEDEQMEVNNG